MACGRSRAYALGDARFEAEPLEAPGDRARDLGHRELGRLAQQGCAALVGFADDRRPAIRGKIIERGLGLLLDHRPLLLDEEDFLEAISEAAQAFGLERPRERHLVEADAEPARVRLGDAELVERLAGIEIGFA